MAADMTSNPPPGKQDAARQNSGPRPIGALIPKLTRPVHRKQAAAMVALMANWPAIVGPALATSVQPRRYAAGTLTLGCAGPVALELQHLAGPLMERINGHFGHAWVQRLRFVQQVLPGPAPPPSVQARRPPVPIDGLPDGALRDALGALGAAIPPDRA